MRRRHKASEGDDEVLCSESGAKLDTQDWRQVVVLSEYTTQRNTMKLTWRQEVETESPGSEYTAYIYIDEQ